MALLAGAGCAGGAGSAGGARAADRAASAPQPAGAARVCAIPGEPTLASPSTSDVQLLRGLAADLRLRAAWITNGVYTIEIPAAALDQYVTRE